jgi:thiol-disulfide isomerase/thioredoxin
MTRFYFAPYVQSVCQTCAIAKKSLFTRLYSFLFVSFQAKTRFTQKLFLLALFSFISTITFSQNNFSFSPQQPKPGDVIAITYEPAGTLLGTTKPIEAVFYALSEKGYTAADDIVLTKSGNKYTGSFKIDPTTNFIFLGFSADDKFDNNGNNGYYILLFENNLPKRNAWNNLSLFYQYHGRQVGVDRDVAKAANALQNEMKLYPEDKDKNIATYARLVNANSNEEGSQLINKEIDAHKSSLKTEDDYVLLENLYGIAKMQDKAKEIVAEKKTKFPNGKWNVADMLDQFYKEKDPVKAKEIATQLIAKAKANPAWELDPWFEKNYASILLNKYIAKKDWDGFKKLVRESNLEKSQLASVYNNLAWDLQGTNSNLKEAEEWSRFATEYARKEMLHPSATKPVHLPTRQWEKQRKFEYAMYADTYAMVQYRLGNYKKGLEFTKDAALTIMEGKNADYNNTYALLAEKALPAKALKRQLEEFVVKGKSTSEMKDILKRLYAKEKGSDKGFDEYIIALQKKSEEGMLEELRKSMLNHPAPAFALLDLNGNKVSSDDLKGKVVVMDFWATWCGPCKASFPGMQKMVNKYKDDPNVKFVFVDTWENGENKKKNAEDFINNNKYTFHVLMDDDNKLVEQFKIEGIPTKFVLDKNGMIRFKEVGWSGSDDKLMAELTAMIELASKDAKKTF